MFDDHSSASGVSADEEALNELTLQLSHFNWKDSVVDKAKRLLFSNDVQENVKGAMNLKAMLCIGREEVYEVAQEVIDAGVIARLVEFLKSDNRDLQWPAAFCLTNVAAGLDEQTIIVVEAGAIEPLIGFLRSADSQLRRQAIFCLANVAGSTPEYRILLARHPLYFTSMFEAASIAKDAKILELICWNLRNVCLLGGPTLEDIKPGVDFLLNQILKKYWNFELWAACIRFAMETTSAVCRSSEGREMMLEQNLLEYILLIIGNLRQVTSSVAQAAFEALAWILAFGREVDKNEFISNEAVLNVIVNRAISGLLGSTIQELALKCLACIAADVDQDRFVHLYDAHPTLFDTCGRVFVELQASSGMPRLSPSLSGQVTPTTQNSAKECTGFIFVSLCLLAPRYERLVVTALMGPDVMNLILEMAEFGSLQIRMKTIMGQATIMEASNAANSPTAAAVSGPLMSTISESLTVTSLKAMFVFLKHGGEVEIKENALQNPFVRICADVDATERLRAILNGTPLPSEGYEVGKDLLQVLVGSS